MSGNRPQTIEPMIDFAILTAIEVERQAILDAFGFRDKHRVKHDGRVYWRGRLALKNNEFYEVVVAQSPDMANLDAALLTVDIMNHWKPGALLMVGIAAAASDEQKLGDVVLGRAVYYYERGKVTAQEQKAEPSIYNANSVLWNQAIFLPPWRAAIPIPRPDGSTNRPNIHLGVIASGEKVIADAAVRDKIAAGHRKIMAIEMEGYGVSKAIWDSFNPVRHLVIRAICDLGDASKNSVWHSYAAAAAAGYAKHFLLDRPLDPRNPPYQQIPKTLQRMPVSYIQPQNDDRQLSINPFTPGTIAHPDRFFGRKNELSSIIGRLQNMLSVAVVGDARIGKSSLLRYLRRNIPAELNQFGHYLPVQMSMNELKSPAEFFIEVLENVMSAIGDEEKFQTFQHRPPTFRETKRILESAENKGYRVVLLLDEVADLLSREAFDDTFLGGLRSLYQESKIALVLASREPLSNILKVKSYFANGLTNYPLDRLTDEASEQLLRQPHDRTFRDDEVRIGLEVGQRHPLRLQSAGYHLYRWKSDPLRPIHEGSGALVGGAVDILRSEVDREYEEKMEASGHPSTRRQTTNYVPSQEEIDQQRELLNQYRRTLASYRKRLAQLGSAHAPPEIDHGLRETREGIGRCKATLRSWGITVADHPDDEPVAR